MHIEFNLLLTIISVVSAVYFALKSNNRTNNEEQFFHRNWIPSVKILEKFVKKWLM